MGLCVKIGIPRSLFYYRFAPFWESFFSSLGAEIVVSDPPINGSGRRRKILVDEACLPIKLSYGHILNLKDRVDYILVPRFTSISKNEYICPEFGGLPDMIRHTLKGLPKLIDTEVNMRKSARNGIKAAVEMGEMIGADRRRIIRAYQSALQNYREDHFYEEFKKTVRKSMSIPVAKSPECENRPLPKSSKCENRPHPKGPECENRPHPKSPECENRPPSPCLRVGVIGHPYNIYDRYISMDLLRKLADHGVEAAGRSGGRGRLKQARIGLAKPMFWNYGGWQRSAPHNENGEVGASYASPALAAHNSSSTT